MSSFDKYQKEIPDSDQPPVKPKKVLTSNPKEAGSDQESNLPSPTEDAGKLLVLLLRVAPFFSLFECVANRSLVGKSVALKVSKLKSAHPRLFWLCFIFDFFIRSIVVGILLAASGYALYKILAT